MPRYCDALNAARMAVVMLRMVYTFHVRYVHTYYNNYVSLNSIEHSQP
jgi:hypothetical protein